jgi:RNA polymerase sigma-70 factor, ECF subfamily
LATTEPDGALVRLARAGDRDAFAELVMRWQRPLFARAMRSTRRLEDADDLVQETFLRAWQGLSRFKGDAPFGAWALRILANLATDRARRAGREVAGDDAWFEAMADRRPDPEETLAGAELARAIGDALAAIPPGRKREVFRMRFVEGRPIKEIAEQLGVHGGTVKVHLFRVARDLRRRLTGREVPGEQP